ncbi:conserved unknown protein [Ectocarpus siliculosus]|uniref:CS domain-containing protein n=1 Tax=Ectocarpus siliculosus TaxID=2880 RepID=D7FQ95_ECTSI|nr:conserved unknown protein [Ectocarpus siliculosus]|eukprot:CBJ48427.1 conserved unknown protein [Ectocarpus siliculosus]
MDMDTRQELAEATALLETAKGPRVRKALSGLVASLQSTAAAEPAEAETDSSSSRTAAAAAAVAASGDGGGDDVPAALSGSHLPEAEGQAAAEAAGAPVVPATKVEGGVPAPPRAPERKYATVEKFAWDQGSFSSPKVSVYVPLEGVGAAKERVSCSFTSRGFDLTVKDLNGKSYRLLQNNLDKDIVPGESKILVKRDKVIVKLQKVKGEYGTYDNWANLAAKKAKRVDPKANPQAGIMDMMKDMYDDGDESTKKLIGEAMLKSHQNRGAPPGSSFDKPDPYGSGSSSSSGLGGLGGLGGGGAGKSSSPFDGLGEGLGGLGGAGGGLGGNLGSMMDDLNMDLDKDTGDGGWGAGGKDDFGFGSAVPPPQASSEPVPAAEEEGEEGGGVEEAKAERSGGGGDAESSSNPLEDLDD